LAFFLVDPRTDIGWALHQCDACGFTPGGLPVGMQIAGPRHADALVLQAAKAFLAERPVPYSDVEQLGVP